MRVHSNDVYNPRLPAFGSWTIRLWDIEMLQSDFFNPGQRLLTSSAFIVLVEGEAGLEIEEQHIYLSAGSMFFCEQECTFALRPREAGMKAMIFHFSVYEADEKNKRELVIARTQRMFTKGSISCPESTKEEMLFKFRQIYECFADSDGCRQWKAQLLFQDMIYEMLTEDRAKHGTTNKLQALEKTKRFIEEHYNEAITNELLAEMSEFSPKYYTELFKKVYGLSPKDYLTKVRLGKAKQFMLGSDRLLREIALRVGYRDEFYFSRRFKKEFGLSPTAYMKAHKNKIAVYGSSSLLGYMIPLQIIPYAAPIHPKWSPYYYKMLGPDVPVHLSAFRQNHNKQQNLDKLALAHPDLIICAPGLEAWEREKLKEIAPIYELYDGGWESRLHALAELLGRKEEADRWLGAWNDRLEKASCLLEKKVSSIRSVMCLRLHGNELCVNEGRGVHEVLFDYLGFQPAELMNSDPSESVLDISDLSNIQAEFIFMLVRQDTETLRYWNELQTSPGWISIQAVRQGNVCLLSSCPWREYSPVAVSRMLEEATVLFSGECP